MASQRVESSGLGACVHVRREVPLRTLYSELLTLALGYMDTASDLENPEEGHWEPELMNESLETKAGELGKMVRKWQRILNGSWIWFVILRDNGDVTGPVGLILKVSSSVLGLYIPDFSVCKETWS